MTEDEGRLARVAPEQAPDEMRDAFARFVRERGRVPNLFRVAAHRPSIGASLAEHMRAVMGPGTVDVRLKELVAVRVSHINRCEY
jgi:alkylhydroperoxidase family enzyme